MNEVFFDIPGIRSRAMFSGHGIYKDGVFFALISGEKLYFKVDDSNRADYQKYKSKPFVYGRPNGKKIEMSYRQLPDTIMEDRDALPEWIEKSIQAQKNAKKQKISSKKKR